jgi:hypothetical protein
MHKLDGSEIAENITVWIYYELMGRKVKIVTKKTKERGQ